MIVAGQAIKCSGLPTRGITMRKIKRIIVHCSDTPSQMDIGVHEIKQWHIQRGFDDIGYHHVVRRSGMLEEGRPLAKAGAHARGFNFSSIGICLVGGDSGLFNFTFDQLKCLVKLVDYYRGQYPDAEILGHRDLPGARKTCPNFDVRSFFGGHYNE